MIKHLLVTLSYFYIHSGLLEVLTEYIFRMSGFLLKITPNKKNNVQINHMKSINSMKIYYIYKKII